MRFLVDAQVGSQASSGWPSGVSGDVQTGWRHVGLSARGRCSVRLGGSTKRKRIVGNQRLGTRLGTPCPIHRRLRGPKSVQCREGQAQDMGVTN